MQKLINPILKKTVLKGILRKDLRWAYNFNGVNNYGIFAKKLIDITQNIDIEFYTPADLSFPSNSEYIVSQCASTTPSAREFELFFSGSSGNIGINVGGSIVAIALAGSYLPSTKYRWTLINNVSTVYKPDGTVLRTITWTRGTATESGVTTTLGARYSAGSSSYTDFFAGVIPSVKINGTLYTLDGRNHTVHLPTPLGVGAELVTEAVQLAPNIKGSQWTYLGNNRWQYIGDGSYNQLILIASSSLPAEGFVEFEIESISGGMACTITPEGSPNYTVNSSSLFNSTQNGRPFRFYYTNKGNAGNPAAGNIVEFKRAPAGLVSSCIIKNISIKPLNTCVPLNLINTTSDRWQEIRV